MYLRTKEGPPLGRRNMPLKISILPTKVILNTIILVKFLCQ